MHAAVPETAIRLGPPAPTVAPRSEIWKWYICSLLLLATSLNYMDRLALNLNADEIKDEFRLRNPGYGLIESAFGFAFAFGAIICGWMADRINVRWLYAFAVLAWSVAGFATGLVQTFAMLLLCRAALGLFEAGNWPCALRTTQRILPPHQRTLGNSLLQSGAALGAILTPLIVLLMAEHGYNWRGPFLVVGGLGLTWLGLWLPSIRSADLQLPPPAPGPSLLSVLGWLVPLGVLFFLVRWLEMEADWTWLPGMVGELFQAARLLVATHGWIPLTVQGLVTVVGIAAVYCWLRRSTHDEDRLPRGLFLQRYWVLVALVVSINTLWHFLRAWLPLLLVNQLGYPKKEMFFIVMAYNIVTDLGALTSGFVALGLTRAGFSVHGSRAVVYLGCALLAALSVVVAFLPAGPWSIGLLLVVGFGALGIFPVYYSFSQELTVKHQGKVTGSLGCICWLSMALLHALVGDLVEITSYSFALALVGLVPLLSCGALFLAWKPEATASR